MPADRDELLRPMTTVVQYRRREGVDGWFGYDLWRTMAAFDALGAAEAYFERQDNGPSSFYEYRMIELPEASA